ncbi:hypothetical protein CHS0354_024719 [Potamilus streckersoni]|uniref:Uncharacterized protein n=1 Tax=Potamilus streckersoni TaxID=2493646 RepID=A0AAE0RXK8_9BIVA|nr:hypothetical protein CHS0354_024719 [Potamilus streckersoni]
MATKDQKIVCIIIILTEICIGYNQALETFLFDADKFDKRHDHPEHSSAPETSPESPCHSMHQSGCERNTIPAAASGICGKTFPKENYLSSNNSLTVQFCTSPNGIQRGTFQIVIGTIESVECYGEFQCKNGRCVDKNEVCNGHDNCRDSSDEVGCQVNPGIEVRLWMVLFITTCVVCFLLLCIILGVIGYRLHAVHGYQRV